MCLKPSSRGGAAAIDGGVESMNIAHAMARAEDGDPED